MNFLELLIETNRRQYIQKASDVTALDSLLVILPAAWNPLLIEWAILSGNLGDLALYVC